MVKKPQKQEEFRDAKGRRRIVPEVVQSPGDGRSPVNETVPVTSLMERLKNKQPGNGKFLSKQNLILNQEIEFLKLKSGERRKFIFCVTQQKFICANLVI